MLKYLLIIATLVSCNVQREGTPIESKIIGGSPVNVHNWIPVVQINLSYWGGSCTGTLIDSRTVLTAAHCAEGYNPKYMSITIKNPKNLFLSKTYRVSNARVHPMYGDNTALQNFDVAYLTLTEDFVESEGNFVPLLSEEELQEVSPNAEITMVGYGKTENGSSGKKLVTSTPIIAITGTEVIAGTATANTCQGDSGGPAFVQLQDGQWRQIGITSRGEAGCKGSGIYELTTANISWLAADKLLVKGISLYNQKKYEEAIEAIDASITKFPLDVSAYLYGARCANALGDDKQEEEYQKWAEEVSSFLQGRLTNYYLSLINFNSVIPQNGIDYGCDNSIIVDSSPFADGAAQINLKVGCDQKVNVTATINNLYRDIKDYKIDFLAYQPSVNHRITLNLPQEEIPEGAWSVISKIFKCTSKTSCHETIDAVMVFDGKTQAFSLYDTYGLKKDQINLRWYLN